MPLMGLPFLLLNVDGSAPVIALIIVVFVTGEMLWVPTSQAVVVGARARGHPRRVHGRLRGRRQRRLGDDAVPRPGGAPCLRRREDVVVRRGGRRPRRGRSARWPPAARGAAYHRPHEGPDRSGRQRDAARRADARHEQAPAARRALADGLLPAAAAAARRRDARCCSSPASSTRASSSTCSATATCSARGSDELLFDLDLTYKVQVEPGGIAQVVGMARDFAGGDKLVVCLGDNIFEHAQADAIASWDDGAIVFVTEVPDPESFGVVAYGDDGRVDRHRREGGRRRHALPRAAVERRGRRALLLPARRLRHHRRRSSRRAAASSRSPTSTARTPQRGELHVRRVEGWWHDGGKHWGDLADVGRLIEQTGANKWAVDGAIVRASRCGASTTSAAGSRS